MFGLTIDWWKEDLLRLISILVALQKRFIILWNPCHSTMITKPRRSTLSTKRIWVMNFFLEILMPFIFPSYFSFSRRRLRPSITIENNNRDKWNPFLRPWALMNFLEVEPFIRMEKLAKDTQPMLQFVTSKLNSIWRRKSMRKVQLKLSNLYEDPF